MSAFATGAATFFPTPFCCLTGTFFLGLVRSVFAGAFTFAPGFALPAGVFAVALPAAVFPVAGFFAAPLAAGLAAPLLVAAALGAAAFPAAALVLAAPGAALPPEAALAAAGLGAGVLALAGFFSAGLLALEVLAAFAAAFGAGAGVFELELELLAPELAGLVLELVLAALPLAGADAGFFFSSFLAATSNVWLGLNYVLNM